MTARITTRTRIALFAVVVLAVALVQFAPGRAFAPRDGTANHHGIDQDIDPLTIGHNACCFMSPDDWIYWDR